MFFYFNYNDHNGNSCAPYNVLSLAVPVNILGQSGVQFFVDAGLPVNEEIVKELVREVIQEQINSVTAGRRTATDTELLPERNRIEKVIVPTQHKTTTLRTQDDQVRSMFVCLWVRLCIMLH